MKDLTVDLITGGVSHQEVHITHCCIRHGCKYGDESCAVVFGPDVQEFPCESCDDEPHFKVAFIRHSMREPSWKPKQVQDLVEFEGFIYVPFETFLELTQEYDVMVHHVAVAHGDVPAGIRIMVDEKGKRFRQR
jgi:hypothetical protein